MLRRVALLTVAVPALLAAQTQQSAPSPSPVFDAFRMQTARYARIIPAAAEAMPADKYGYKPTPAQMSFGDIVVHLIEANDGLCAVVAGTKAAEHPKLVATSAKDSLVAQLKSSFDFCTTSFANMTDASLSKPASIFGMNTTQAGLLFINVGDWADHYSQFANYMRLNGVLPPTAKPKPTP
ncbi:MAG TPA: DinB family protein [Gemmatimonadaceae bacterium]|nr:DinB family protein [Gemmatimonadaceae bacterium]